MVIRDVISDSDRAAVRRLLEEGFEVRPGLGEAFARVYGYLAGKRSRIAVDNDRIVGHALNVKRLFNLDSVELPGAILAMVVVAPEFQGRGIGSALVEDAEAIASANGAVLMHVAGDLEFYRRFGYVDGYVSSRAELEPKASQSIDSDSFRYARVSDAALLARLSSAETPCGSVVCNEARWQRVLESKHPVGLLKKNDILLGFKAQQDFCLLCEAETQPKGFARFAIGEGSLAVYEGACEDEKTADELLAAICEVAGQNACTRMILSLPKPNRLMQAAIS